MTSDLIHAMDLEVGTLNFIFNEGILSDRAWKRERILIIMHQSLNTISLVNQHV